MALIDYLPLYIRCGMSFSANWYHHHANSQYNENIMLDPLKRYKMLNFEAQFIRKKYPAFFPNEENYKRNPSLGIGVATVPKIMGCRIKYENNMDPFAYPLLKPDEDVFNLKEPDYDEAMNWLMEEVDKFVEMGFKKERIGLPDLQGPLNIAVKVIGDKRMLSLIARRNKRAQVEQILEITSNTYIEVRKRLLRATNHSVKSPWSVSGCTYYYLSSSQWEKYILPIIEKCAQELGNTINLHHCGEADAKKLESYAKFPFTSVELGFGSDLKRARELFIHPKIGPVAFSCRISPYRMLNQSASQIEEDVKWITDRAWGGPVSINCVGIAYGTPEENLYALWDSVQAYNKKKEEEMEDED